MNDVDIVSCATLATQPVVQGAWLRPRSHLDLIGSFTPQMREADDVCFAGARLFVDTQEALQKSGELLGPMSRGVFAAEDVAGTLADLVTDRTPGRTQRDGRTVFKAVGTALEDLAAAVLAYGASNRTEALAFAGRYAPGDSCACAAGTLRALSSMGSSPGTGLASALEIRGTEIGQCLPN